MRPSVGRRTVTAISSASRMSSVRRCPAIDQPTTRRLKTSKGETIKQTEYFYGYKTHVSLNSETELITSVQVTSGNRYDGHELPGLLEKDLAQGIPVETVTADRGYDDSDSTIC